MRKWFFILTVLSSCATADLNEAKKGSKIITHYNIVIAPDLSNRIDENLYPRQLNDLDVIEELLHVFSELPQKYNRLSYQKDKFQLMLINENDAEDFKSKQKDLSIDLGAFSTQRERIDFLKNKSSYSFKSASTAFLDQARNLYVEALKNGFASDLWGFFNHRISPLTFSLSDVSDQTIVKHQSRNVLIVLTDGYIDKIGSQSSDCNSNNCKWLSDKEIKGFRAIMNGESQMSVLKQAFNQSDLRLTPVENESLKDVEVLFLEAFDRSKSESGRVLKYPSDFQVLKLFWSKFFEDSGVKKFEIHQTAGTRQEINQILKGFLGDF